MTLLAYLDVTCQWATPNADGDARPCGLMSRFVVRRSDGDESFGWDGKHESCEPHLGYVVSAMIDGDDTVEAVVTIRWNAAPGERPEQAAKGET